MPQKQVQTHECPQPESMPVYTVVGSVCVHNFIDQSCTFNDERPFALSQRMSVPDESSLAIINTLETVES